MTFLAMANASLRDVALTMRNLSLRERWWTIGFGICMLGIVFSQAIFSIMLYGLSLMATFELLISKPPGIRKSSFLLLVFPWLFVLCIPLLQNIYLSTNSPDIRQYKLYMLLLPFLGLRLSIMSAQAKKMLVDLTLMLCCINGLIITGHLAVSWADWGHKIEQGHHLWVPNGQPKATAILMATVSIVSVNTLFRFPNKSFFRKVAITLLVIVIHFMTVRIAWIMVYLGVGGSLFLHLIHQKRWKTIAGGTLLLISLPIMMYYTIPSLASRVNYTIYDWASWKSNDTPNTSDALRFTSWDIGWKAMQTNPAIGVGTLAMEEVINEEYTKHYPEIAQENRIRPHNQFLYIGLELGIVGCICCIVAMLCLLIYFYHVPSIILWALFFLYCFIDCPLNRQVILAIFWFGLVLSASHSKESHAS